MLTNLTQFFEKIYHRQKEKSEITLSLKSLWRHPLHALACGGGVGLLPAPGTWGTLLGILVYLMLHGLPLTYYLVVTLLLNVLGVFLCNKINKDLKTEDHPAAIWDEIAAFPIVMIHTPCTWYFIVIGFLLFRFFDIVKPGPIGWLDRHVHGGFGVMIDDIAAALVSFGMLQCIVLFFFPT